MFQSAVPLAAGAGAGAAGAAAAAAAAAAAGASHRVQAPCAARLTGTEVSNRAALVIRQWSCGGEGVVRACAYVVMQTPAWDACCSCRHRCQHCGYLLKCLW